MMSHCRAALCCLPLVASVAAAQQRCELLVAGAVHGVHVRGAAEYDGAGASLRAELPAGTWRLHFPAGGGGRPAPLEVEANAGGRVFVAVAPAPGGEPDTELAATLQEARTFEVGDGHSVRVCARIKQAADGGAAGVVARWSSADDHYRFVRDPKARELRLERRLGGHDELLQRTALAAVDGGWHDLELEVDGFGLLALFDDVPVARVLDGALTHGACGTFVAQGAHAEFEGLRAAPPTSPLPSAAVVTAGGAADYVARTVEPPGSTWQLLLRIDRPTAPWPTGALGFEVPLLVGLAEPVFLFGHASGFVGDGGAIAAHLDWPAGHLLGLQAALLGGWVGSPDASELRARLPWVALRF
jgi:hypothetical protein